MAPRRGQVTLVAKGKASPPSGVVTPQTGWSATRECPCPTSAPLRTVDRCRSRSTRSGNPCEESKIRPIRVTRLRRPGTMAEMTFPRLGQLYRFAYGHATVRLADRR